ncbi:hypothetical protein F5Y16DRAFT_390247 [Xylariaceae sp. FL0255]|nr:hypothetical protein F5Y16DRAFT_390247 [Xylariaceae sp. FL0255]
MKSWPFYDDPSPPFSVVKTVVVPALWPSKLISTFFWNDSSTPRKSDAHFHGIHNFRSVGYCDATGYLAYRPPIQYFANIPPPTPPDVEKLAQVWATRETTWRFSRAGWYNARYNAVKFPSSYRNRHYITNIAGAVEEQLTLGG